MSLVSCMCESANSITWFKFLQIQFLGSSRETITANLFLVSYMHKFYNLGYKTCPQ